MNRIEDKEIQIKVAYIKIFIIKLLHNKNINLNYLKIDFLILALKNNEI